MRVHVRPPSQFTKETSEQRLERAHFALRVAEKRWGVASVSERSIEDSIIRPSLIPISDGDPKNTTDPLLRQLQCLSRGVIHAHDGYSSLFRTVAHVLPEKGWAAFVGVQNVGWVAAQHQGLDLKRMIVIPGLDGRAVEVLSALIETINVVCVGNVQLNSAHQHRIAARARKNRNIIITLQAWYGISKSITSLGEEYDIRVG